MTYDEILALTPAELREAIAKLVEPTITYSIFDVPNWPENISDAWKLFEELPLFTTVMRFQGGFYAACGGKWEGEDDEYKYESLAETAPLAICMVWLMWKEGNGK